MAACRDRVPGDERQHRHSRHRLTLGKEPYPLMDSFFWHRYPCTTGHANTQTTADLSFAAAVDCNAASADASRAAALTSQITRVARSVAFKPVALACRIYRAPARGVPALG